MISVTLKAHIKPVFSLLYFNIAEKHQLKSATVPREGKKKMSPCKQIFITPMKVLGALSLPWLFKA